VGYPLIASAQTLPSPYESGDILLRARAILVEPGEEGTVSRPIGGEVSLSRAVIPEIDATYFWTPHIATEIILGAIPHDVKVKNSARGEIDVGSVWVAGPAVMMQYHHPVTETVTPYIGLGGAYAVFLSNSKEVDIEYGQEPALIAQAGVNVQISENWFANADVKKAWLSTDAKVNGGAITAEVNLDPIVAGVGIGYRF
jgi:outer membrane protein